MGVFDLICPSRTRRLAWHIKKLNPLVYYPLDDVTGNALNKAQISKDTLNGTPTAGVTRNQDGKLGKSMLFTAASSGEIDCGTTSALDLGTDPFSMICLLKTSTQGGQMMSKEDGINAPSFEFLLEGATGKADIYIADANYTNDADCIGTTDVADGNWHLVVATKGSNLKIYVDGVLETTVDASSVGSLSVSDENLFLGSLNGSNYFNGNLQHLAIVPTELNAHYVLKLAQIAGVA